jgi:hypothetical protein
MGDLKCVGSWLAAHMFYQGIVSAIHTTAYWEMQLTMKNGVPAGIMTPLYVIGLMLWRVNDMLSVDQKRRTSCVHYKSCDGIHQGSGITGDLP